MKLSQLNLAVVHLIKIISSIVIITLSIKQYKFANASGNETDHLALLEFKRGISDDPLGVLSAWNDSAAFCRWRGVTCSRRHPGRVVAIELPALELRGSMSPDIGNLTFLKLIDLSRNDFHGRVPSELGGLFRLQRIILANNSFTGEIPVQLYNCTQLKILDLGWNNLTGRLSPRIGSLTKLVQLLLSSNSLTGPIPPSVGNLSSLEYFYAHYNSLEGKIPEEIGRLKNFSILAMGGNKLSGDLPAPLYNMSSLAVISTAVNKLTGSLPDDIGLTLPNLIGLAISNNEFSGRIPTSLANASKLQALQLSRNNFVGEVPRDLGNRLVDLWGLGLSSNYLGRNSSSDLRFVASLKNMSKLRILDLGDNQFGGVYPSSIVNLSTQLSELYLSSNQIYGYIPEGFEKYSRLNVLDLSSNLLTGTIPSSFGKLHNIQGMYLNQNRLSGPIPFNFGNLTLLTQVYLSENEINGAIPPSIRKCEKLQYLDISRNKLTGSIPKEIGDLSSLSLLLNLSHNLLIGDLPVELGRLKNINALDFSRNRLSGEIPSAIGDCTSLEYLNLQGNSLRGVIPSSLASLKGLTHLDLSQNRLSGSIPKDLQNLKYLVYFNASINDLEGEMPTKGVFGNASAISMDGNKKLCGGISELQMPPCANVKAKKPGISRVALVIIISSACLLILLLSSFFLIYLTRKSKKNEPSDEDTDPYRLSKVSYKMLYDASGGFSPNNLIGSGRFGSVYRGILDQTDDIVAIKVLKLWQKGASKSFMAECRALRKIRHRNLVKIVTSCSSIDYQGNEFKALVFDYIENRSLEEWLHPTKNDESHTRTLSFLQRLNIAIDVASAVHYLHCECMPAIAHCDLKPSNIMLDNDMVAHVGDFGLARILAATNGASQSQSSIGLKGSIGYAAPEYGVGGKASIEGDVYSYGILLLEIFTGKRPTDEIFEGGLCIHRYVRMALPEIVNQSLVVMELDGQNAAMRRCLLSVLELGLRCSADAPKDRMEIGDVIRKLAALKNAFMADTPKML